MKSALYPYFAYGSNLLGSQMEKRVGRVPPAKRARLRNFRLAFNKRAQNGGVYANVIAARDDEAWGVLYACTERELAKLDTCEGVPTHYVRCTATAQVENEEPCIAYVYLATPEYLCDEARPSNEYLASILGGAAEHSLPGHYVQRLRSLGQQGAT